MVNKKADLGTKVLIGLLIVFVIGIVFMSKPTITGFAVVEQDDTRLEIYDETNTTVKYAGDDIIFYANYTNLTDETSISGACNITFEDSADNAMTYASDLYTYTRNFTDNGTFAYVVNCTNELGYVNLDAAENAFVSGVPPVCDSCENCTILAQSSGLITLQNNIGVDTASCIVLGSSNVEIDCAGHSIYAGPVFIQNVQADCGIDAWQDNFVNITVHDCVFTDGAFGYGSWVNDSLDYNNSATSDVTFGRNSYMDINTIIENNSYYFMEVDYGNNVTVRNNIVGNYLLLWDTNNSLIYGNNISDHYLNGGGITLEGSLNNNISNNYISLWGACPEICTFARGVLLKSGSNNNLIQENQLIPAGDFYTPIRTESSFDNILTLNKIGENSLYLINLIGGSNLTLLNQNLSKEYGYSNIVWENFNGTLTSGTNSYVSVGDRYASVNSELAPEVNLSAIVTLSFSNYFNGIYFYDNYSTDADTIVNNGQICNEGTTPACTNVQIAPGQVTFGVDHFSSYAVNTSSCVVPFDNYYVASNITLCNNDYTVDDADGDGLFIVNASNIIIDCNGSTLNGDSSDDVAFKFASNSISSVTIKNCNFNDYYTAIDVGGASSNLIYSNNFTNSVSDSISILLGSYNQIYSNRFEDGAAAGINIAGTSGCILDPDPGTCYARYNNNKIFTNTFVNQTTGVQISTAIGGSCGSGLIRCSNPTTNNSVYSNTFNESDTSVYLGTTTANINNLRIYNSISYDIYAEGSSTNYIINTSVDRDKIYVAGTILYFMWPITISTVASSSISIKDAQNTTISKTANTGGYAYVNLTEFGVDSEYGYFGYTQIVTNYTPYNISVSKSGYYSNSTTAVINQSKTISIGMQAMPSTGGDDEGSGSGGLAPYVAAQITTFNADFNEKDNFDIKMTKLDKLSIKTKKGIMHTLRILRTDTVKKSCIIEVASTPKNYTIALDETIQVDYENDGVKDLEIKLTTFGTYWTFLLKELNVAQPKEQVVEIPAESKEPVVISPQEPATEQPTTTTKKDYTWAWTLLFFALIASVLVSVIATRKHTKKIDEQIAETRKTEQQIPMPEMKFESKPIKTAEPKTYKQADKMAIPESDLSKIRALDDINKRIDEINRNIKRF